MPVPKREIGREHDRLLLVAARHDLNARVGGVRIVGEVADLVDAEKLRTQVVLEPPVERTIRLLAVEIEQEVGGRREQRRVAVQNRLMHGVLRDHRLAQALGADEHEILGAAEEVEREHLLDERAVEGFGPAPLEVGHGLEAAEPRAFEAALEAAVRGPRARWWPGASRRATGGQRSFAARASRSFRSSALRVRPRRRS